MLLDEMTPSFNESVFNSSFTQAPYQHVLPGAIIIPEIYRISFTICYALILVLSVVGNSSVIAIVVRNPSMRTTINYLIANMAATDLAAAVVVTGRFFSISHNLSTAFEVSGVLGNIFCKLGPYIRDVSISVSIHSMVAIAFDRFFAVVYPMRATPRLLDIRVILPAIWLLALGFFSVALVNFKLITFQGVDFCEHLWPPNINAERVNTILYFTFLIVFFLGPMFVVTILYSIIAVRVRRQIIPGEQTSSAESRRRKRNNNILKMAAAIVFCFFGCWSPYHIYGTLRDFVWKENIPESLLPHVNVIDDIFIVVSFISFAINPFICFFFSSNYRKCVRNLFPFKLFFTTRIGPLEDTSQRSGTNRTQRTEMYSLNQ